MCLTGFKNGPGANFAFLPLLGKFGHGRAGAAGCRFGQAQSGTQPINDVFPDSSVQCPWVCARLYMLIVPVAQFVTGALVIASDDEDEGPLSDQEAERRTKAAEEFNKGPGEWPSLLFPAYAWSLSHCVLLSRRYRRIFPDSSWRWSPYSGGYGWYWTALD